MKKIQINTYPRNWNRPFTAYEVSYPENFQTPEIELKFYQSKIDYSNRNPYEIIIEANDPEEAKDIATSFGYQLKDLADHQLDRITLSIIDTKVQVFIHSTSTTFVGLKKTYH